MEMNRPLTCFCGRKKGQNYHSRIRIHEKEVRSLNGLGFSLLTKMVRTRRNKSTRFCPQSADHTTYYKVVTTLVIRPLYGRTYCGRSAFTRAGEFTKAIRLFMASLHSQPMCSQMCSLDILVDLQPFGGLEGTLGSEIAPPPFSSLHVGLLVI